MPVKNTHIKLGLLIFLLFFGMKYSAAQSEEYLLKAGFLERFTRFIDWPMDSLKEKSEKPFNILVLGENPFGDILNRFYENTNIKNRKVRIEYADEIDTNKAYHLIFISGSEKRRLNNILSYTQNKPILTVAETEGFGEKGVLINFYIEKNRIRFEINNSAFQESKLSVSHLLMNVATVI